MHLARSGAHAAPEISPRYLTTPGDREIALRALRHARKLMTMPALRKYAPQEALPGTKVVSDADLIRAAGDIGTTIFHPVGTCKMGQDNLAVVSTGRHLCLEMRGIQPTSEMFTTSLGGVFGTDSRQRSEFMDLVRG